MYSTRIYYQDTDAGGVVYFANYLKFVEKSWFEHLLSIGISIPEWESKNTYIIVKNVSLDLIEPLRYADIISVETRTVEVKHAYFLLSHAIIKGEKQVTRCETKMVCIDRSGRPKRMPEEFRTNLLQDMKNG
ncbi:MAG TPA: YbgC/FadM family acyl-CoA thioesterase [Syntrophorhabdaceae bacterium]|nr:YbgC/FadM family acyl-CoA thioesterase [Syntrophorhabdaceae bacterium]